MAKKPIVPVCSRCETPFRSQAAFCRACGGPTPWASHDERVAYEVRQWRASRATTEPNKPQMMLVRTEEGFEAVPMQRQTYTWDQPLHPERETVEQPAIPVTRAETATALLEPPTPEPAPVNGHSNGNGNENGHPAYLAHEHGVVPDVEPEPFATETEPAPLPSALYEDDDRVTVSKRAVVIGLALVLGLPLGGKLMSLGGGPPSSPPSRGATAAGPQVKAAALIASRSGFDQITQDAVRYAVVIRNPNRSLLASNVTVKVSMHDKAGRLVGSDVERVNGVPPAGSVGVAGLVSVARPAARLTVRLGVSSFSQAIASRSFVVRNVSMTKSAGAIVVTSGISGKSRVDDARVVAVYLDRSGKIVAGDSVFVDVPRSPHAVTAVVTTAGLRRAVSRVEIYVLSPR